MMRKQAFFLVPRLLFVALMLATSAYCLLAYIPFSYFHFLKFNHLAGLTAFVKYHPYLYCFVAGLLCATMGDELRNEKTRRVTLGFLCFVGLTGAALCFFPLLANLQNNFASFLYSLLALVPVLWLALLDGLASKDKITWSSGEAAEDLRIFRSSLLAAIFISLLYAGIFYARQKPQAAEGLSFSEWFVVISWSLASHLLVFMALFVVFNLLRAIAKLFALPARAEFILCNGLGIAMLAFSLRNIAFAGISFYGGLANFYALAVASVCVGWLASLSFKLYRTEDGAVSSGLSLALLPLTFGRISSRLGQIIRSLSIVLLAYLLAVRLASFDWNYLAQKLTVNLIWVLTFAILYAMSKESKSKAGLTYILLLVAAMSLGLYKLLDASQATVAAFSADKKLNVRSLLESYSGQDVSFRLVHEMLTPSQDDGSFYAFLQQNTNIPQDTRIEPMEIKLVPELRPAQNPQKPNIFIFTIDSLRQDYLSPYNKEVHFTPAIQRFADESIVMENAFTRYGATGLSEPSIWVGGMMIHKQYVTPFYPMNSLQKLIEAEGYQALVSMDTILNVIVKPAPYIEDLTSGADNKDALFDFCDTLKTLQNRLDKRQANAPPVFAYTQPQNIHVSVIKREGETVVGEGDYGKFHAPYASRIKKFDDCFGAFIAYLKQRNLYDNSIIVLTADHGDSLGEDGRWGHAYTLFPEIIRIPLLIHLPQGLRNHLLWDTRNVAFSTDITPSLYYLLGHKPIAKNELTGRPLFTASQQEQTDYLRPSYLLASSYGAVYGILSNNGRSLYIADGVNYTDYFYDLERDPAGRTNLVNPAVKAEQQKLIFDGLERLNQAYKFSP
jgi:arylsulfatase A-like enzyme